jgi:hypothetical protein
MNVNQIQGKARFFLSITGTVTSPVAGLASRRHIWAVYAILFEAGPSYDRSKEFKNL